MSGPLNHPNHSLETRRGDIRPMYESLGQNKSTIIRINTQTIESIDSTDTQKAIFHLNKTKTFIKSLNLENNISLNGLKPNSSDSIVVYRLSADKNKDLLRRSIPSSQSTQSSDTGSHKKRYLVSQRSGKVYEIVEKSKVNPISVKREASEPDTDLICDDEYFKYLNLIGSKRLKTETKSSLNQWSLRNISKVVPNPKFDNFGRLILTEICPKPKSSETDINSNNNEDQREGSRRKLAKSQWLTEVKDSTNRLVDQKGINEMSRKRDKELKEWKTNAFNTISFFSLSSFMSKRIFRSLFCPLNHLQKYLKTMEIERYCSQSYVKYLASLSLSCNGVTRITRTRDGNDWNPRNYQHKYCFNRLQRLEKWKQLETGLNWRSRLIKSNCKRVEIQIHRMVECPICSETIDFDPRHQCYQFESHLRTTNSSFRSDLCDSSDEVVIIGDDFMSEDMTNNTKSINKKCSAGQVIKQIEVKAIEETIDEDDDIMIVEEVFKTKNNNIILKSLLKPSISSKSVNCAKRPSNVSSCLRSQSSGSSSVRSDSQKSISSVKRESNSEQSCSQQNFIFVSNLFK